MYDNIVNHKGVVSYYYKVRPINSLFASESQCETLIDSMLKLIQDINMPGAIYIKPKKINNQKIYKAYADNFKKYGSSDFIDLAKDYISSLKEILSQAVKYRYEIYFVFCDGREELKKKNIIKLFNEETKPLPKRYLSMYQIVEQEIHKKLSRVTTTTKLSEEEVEALNNYLALPIENTITEYYVEEEPSEIKYSYQVVNSSRVRQLYTRTHVVSSFESLQANSKKSNDVLNTLQLESYPSDVVIKFDLEQTREFKKNMLAKKERIRKDQKRFVSLADRKDKETSNAEMIAKIGSEVDASIENSKVRFQMFVRLRSNSKEMLDKRSDSLRTKFDGRKIILSNQIGDQITMANNLFPYRTSFKHCINTSDIAYFVRYNYLGGLYIGDEEEGMINTYTVPGGVPVFHDLSKPLLGKTKTGSTVSAFVGETRAGKTQLADLEAFQNMIFKGMKVLTVDPKGDREKKLKLLGNRASHLCIGSKECIDGMFDPYLINKDTQSALSQVMRDIDSMVHILKLQQATDFDAIEKAHRDMLLDKKNKKIRQCTLTYLLEEKLPKYDSYIGKQILTLRNDTMMRLFFATKDTDITNAFTLNKAYNLITFEKLPSDIKKEGWEYDPNRMDHAIFGMTLSRVQWLIERFMKMFKGSEKIVIFDEYKVYQRTPGGEEIVDNIARQAGSWFLHVFIITQELSSISSGILNNVGEIYVGSLKSSAEIEYILKEMKLENHSTIRGALIDRTTDEGVMDSKKYNFLMQDYNNRKCLTKNKIPRCFLETFRTLKDEESEDEENVPVTGTKEEKVIYDE